MKFTKAEAFEKHLEEALPGHPSPIYALIIADPFERQFILESLLGKLEGEKSRWTAPEPFLAEIESQSLFTSRRILIYEGAEKLKKEKIAKELARLPEGTHVILCGNALPFYEELKQEMVVLDLSEEKPWERSNRLKRWLLQTVQKSGKRLSPEAAAYLAEFSSSNFESLLKEIEKLAIYVGDESLIELEDMRAICNFDHVETLWQISEAIVWKGSVHQESLYQLNAQDLHHFLGQLRYQLQLGLVIASSIERSDETAIHEEYPKLRANTLDKCKQLAKAYKTSYFKKGLEDLFKLELESRKKIAGAPLLLDHFAATLKKRRSHG